jgi:hypothetical protein
VRSAEERVSGLCGRPTDTGDCSAGCVSAEKGAGALEGLLAFVEMGGEGLEHVGYPGHDFEGAALMVINVVTQVHHLRAAANSVEVTSGVVTYMLGVTEV